MTDPGDVGEAPEVNELPESGEASVLIDPHDWREALLRELRAIRACLERAPWMRSVVEPALDLIQGEPTVTEESRDAAPELPGHEDPLGTWILTDQRVAAIEAAIVQEQQVRGTAYGG